MALARFTSTDKHDPFLNFNYVVYLGDEPVAACRKVSGLTASVEVVKFRAGNSLSTADELIPGRVSYDAITLEAAITNDKAFKEWANKLIHHEASKYAREPEPSFRRDLKIHVFGTDNDHSRPVKKYTVHKAWVSKFTALSELAADANEVLIETIEIQNEGFTEEEVG